MSAMHFCSISANDNHSSAFLLLLHIMPWLWTVWRREWKNPIVLRMYLRSCLVAYAEANEMWLYILKQDCSYVCILVLIILCMVSEANARMWKKCWLLYTMYTVTLAIALQSITLDQSCRNYMHFSRSKWRHWHKVEFHPLYAWAAVLTTQYHK